VRKGTGPWVRWFELDTFLERPGVWLGAAIALYFDAPPARARLHALSAAGNAKPARPARSLHFQFASQTRPSRRAQPPWRRTPTARARAICLAAGPAYAPSPRRSCARVADCVRAQSDTKQQPAVTA